MLIDFCKIEEYFGLLGGSVIEVGPLTFFPVKVRAFSCKVESYGLIESKPEFNDTVSLTLKVSLVDASIF